jgi:hypothetical protein
MRAKTSAKQTGNTPTMVTETPWGAVSPLKNSLQDQIEKFLGRPDEEDDNQPGGPFAFIKNVKKQ